MMNMFKLIANTISFVFIAIVITGCNVTADAKANAEPAPDYVQQLSWLKSADAEQDAKAAIFKQDYRLFAMAGRGQRIPGVKPEDVTQLKARCGVQILKGSTDVVRGDDHLALLQELENYAKHYNQLVSQNCP